MLNNETVCSCSHLDRRLDVWALWSCEKGCLRVFVFLLEHIVPVFLLLVTLDFPAIEKGSYLLGGLSVMRQ